MALLATAGSSKVIAADTQSGRARSRDDLSQVKLITDWAMPVGGWQVITTIDAGLGSFGLRLIEPGIESEDISSPFVVNSFLEPHHVISGSYGLPLKTSPVNVDAIEAYGQVRSAAVESRNDALLEIRRRLDSARAQYAQASPSKVATYLIAHLGV